MEKKKGNRIVAIFMLIVLLFIAVGSSVFYKENAPSNTISIDSLNSNDAFIDDLFINNMIQYKELIELKDKKELSYTAIFLNERYENSNTGYQFEDTMMSLEDNYWFYNYASGIIDTFAEYDNQRVYSLDLSDLKQGNNANQFAWYIIMSYDDEGVLSYKNASNEFLEHANSKFFSGSLMHFENFNFEPIIQNKVLDNGAKITVNPIKNATFIYAISNETVANLNEGNDHFRYLNTGYTSYDDIAYCLMGCLALTILISLLVPLRHMKTLKSYKIILSMPFEVLLIGLSIVIALLGMAFAGVVPELSRFFMQGLSPDIDANIAYIGNVAVTAVIMYLFMISVTFAVYALKDIFNDGFKNYCLNHTLTGSLCKKLRQIIHVFEGFTISEAGNRKLMFAVLINFVVGCIASTFFVGGYLIFFVYSVALMVYLLKVFRDIQKNYDQLEGLTTELSKGNLDVEIEGDMCVFNEIKKNLLDVKSGFKDAVEEEVKSQRMKTELISNVSHDLKTPLTTLISYIDLLQHDDLSEEERKRYITILDGSSMRLKRCIEDLFEISKVESGNVSCNLVNVNLVDLMKQTHFELSDKIEKSSLIFRLNYPNNKVICLLDSSKTYRIFENLYINILKYALPNSRVFIELKEDEDFAYMSFKNISAKEITYEGNELTERFVRNDASRNSDGSGLGLAIAKSFTELMKGEFRVEIEGDYFKVFVKFRKNGEFKEVVEPILDLYEPKEEIINIAAEIVEEPINENKLDILKEEDNDEKEESH